MNIYSRKIATLVIAVLAAPCSAFTQSSDYMSLWQARRIAIDGASPPYAGVD